MENDEEDLLRLLEEHDDDGHLGQGELLTNLDIAINILEKVGNSQVSVLVLVGAHWWWLSWL